MPRAAKDSQVHQERVATTSSKVGGLLGHQSRWKGYIQSSGEKDSTFREEKQMTNLQHEVRVSWRIGPVTALPQLEAAAVPLPTR